MRSGLSKLSRFQDFRLRTKLGALVALAGIPILVLVALQYQQTSTDISFASSEKDGMLYIGEGPMELLYDVQRHRLLQSAVMNGEPQFAEQLAQARADVENDLQKLAALDSAAGDWETADLVALVMTRWNEVKQAETAGSAAAIASHNNMVEQGIIPLIFQAATESNLYIDGHVTTLDTSIGVLNDLVRASEASNRAAAYALAAGRAESLPQGEVNEAEANAQLQAGETARESLSRWLKLAMAADSSFRAGLDTPLQSSNVEADRLATRINASLRSSAYFDSPELVTLGLNSVDSNKALFDAGSSLVSATLDTRTSDLRSSQVLVLALIAGAFAVSIAVAWLIAASITRPIERLAYIADQMSLGQLEIEIDVESKNEVGQLAESLRRMQASLKGAIERLRTRKSAA